MSITWDVYLLKVKIKKCVNPTQSVGPQASIIRKKLK